jgi:hypothetical protein
LLKDSEKDILRQVNKKECDVLADRWSSSEFIKVITEFWKPKMK